MKRLSLVLAGLLLLAGAAPASAERPGHVERDHHGRGPARVSFTAVTARGEHRGQHFRADRVRVLVITVDWRTLVGVHTQQLELVAPDGAVYQRFSAPVESVSGHAAVETRVPVAGTWITQYSLLGKWHVRVYLDEGVAPVTVAAVTLAK